jgi:DUF4097 and DUF4098 domain-containing protein YvlB
MKTVMAALALVISALPALARDESYAGVKRVDLRVSAGDVNVTGVDGSATVVGVTEKRYDERCRLTMEQKGDLLIIELASRNLFRANCEADFEIRVPRAMDLKFKTGSGNVRVAGTSGPVTIETGSGEVDVRAKLLAFDARVGSGSVRAEGLEAPASVRTGSGSVHLVYDKVPAEGELAILSGSGDAEVLFPKHARIRTTFTAGSGSLKNRLGDTPNARFTVSMKTGSGDLTVGNL